MNSDEVEAKFGTSVCCEICGARPDVDSTIILNRINPKGIIGVWRCQYHFIQHIKSNETYNPPRT